MLRTKLDAIAAAVLFGWQPLRRRLSRLGAPYWRPAVMPRLRQLQLPAPLPARRLPPAPPLLPPLLVARRPRQPEPPPRPTRRPPLQAQLLPLLPSMG